MTTLRSSSSKLIVDKYRDTGFFVSQKEFLLTRPEICSLKSQKAVNFGFLKLISLQHKAVHPVTTLSSKNQVFSVVFLLWGSVFFFFFGIFAFVFMKVVSFFSFGNGETVAKVSSFHFIYIHFVFVSHDFLAVCMTLHVIVCAGRLGSW